MPQICIASPNLAYLRLQQLGLTAKEYEEEGIWTIGCPKKHFFEFYLGLFIYGATRLGE